VTAVALAIVVAFGLASAVIAAMVWVQAKRAPRIPNYHKEYEEAAIRAREAGVRARDRIRREANSRQS
jgi:hypothetical protein